MFYNLATILLFILCKCLFKLKVEGKNLLPEAGPFILASNHISNLDPIIVGVAAFPRQVHFLAKEELFSNKLFSFILKDIGAVPLKRRQADIKAIRVALNVLKKSPLVIFPQGARSTSFDKADSGAGFLYKKTRVPLIAVRIYGTDKILPKGAKFFSQGKIKVIFSKVNNLNNNDSYEDIVSKVMDKIKNL